LKLQTTLVFTKAVINMPPSTIRERFDVYNALEACSQHLEQFGGHMYAAGMTLKEELFLFKAFEKSTETIHPDLLLPEIDIDAEINFADITQN
jgi:single-stranded-DNA-specific exonuclease